MYNFIVAIITKYRTLVVIILLLVLSGINAIVDIHKEADPDVNIPYFSVSVNKRGISPEDAESLLIKPLEIEFKSLSRLKSIRSNSQDNGGYLILEFELGIDYGETLTSIKDAVDKVKVKFPNDTNEPMVKQMEIGSQQILSISLTMNAPNFNKYNLVNDIKDKIASVGGVEDVEVHGLKNYVTAVSISLNKLQQYNLSVGELSSILQRSNLIISSGEQIKDDGQVVFKADYTVKSIKAIEDIPIINAKNTVVLLKDIAIIREYFLDKARRATFDGKDMVKISITKTGEANTLATVEKIKKIMDKFEQANKKYDIKHKYDFDGSDYVYSMLLMLFNTLILSIIIVIFTISVILGKKSALMICISIPLSLLVGLVLLQVSGNSLNILSMFAFILSIGLLVDASIVFVEYANRKLQSGFSVVRAYALSVQQMAIPLFTSTLTTLVAFIPLLFMPGIMGKFFLSLPLTLIFVLTASFIIAIIFLPSLGILFSYIGSRAKGGMKSEADLLNVDNMENSTHTKDGTSLDMEKTSFILSYLKMLRVALRYPKSIISVAVTFLFVTVGLFTYSDLGTEFMSNMDLGVIDINVKTFNSFSPKQRSDILSKISSDFRNKYDFKKYIAHTSTLSNTSSDKIGNIILNLVDWQKRPTSLEVSQVIIKEIALKGGYNGISFEVKSAAGGPQRGYDLNLEIASNDIVKLQKVAEKFFLHMKEDSSLYNFNTNLHSYGYSWNLNIERAKVMQYGVDTNELSRVVQLATSGANLASYYPSNATQEIDIRAYLPKMWHTSYNIPNLTVKTRYGYMPLSNFLNLQVEHPVQRLERKNYMNTIYLHADVQDKSKANAITDELTKWFKQQNYGEDIRLGLGENRLEEDEASSYFIKAFLAVMMLLLMILTTQYNSFFYSLVTLSAIIFSISGVLIGLMIFAMPYGILFTSISIFALSGIVVNNNIILIDTYKRLLANGLPFYDALLETCSHRLRPVLLTMITSALGLLPSAIGLTIDFVEGDIYYNSPMTAFWSGVSVVLLSGLIFATGLTLLVTPSMIYIKERHDLRKQNAKKEEYDPAVFDNRYIN